MEKKKIVIGITGSISAFKTIQLISDLSKENYIIDICLTKSATKFVTKETIEALTKRKVYIDVFDDDVGSITHIDLVKDASLFMVVPASANTIAKIANGICDNMLTASFLAATCPKLVAPAMNSHMLENVATKRNINTLKNDGIYIVNPDIGMLACGVTGKGKLASFSQIRLMMDYALSNHPLKGKKVLITAGATKEALDPVRFISNHSTGKMGYALARASFILGADVHLISGETSLEMIPYISHEIITNASELFETIKKEAPFFDIIIMSAAVSDYRPINVSDEKIKKHDDTLTITFTKNEDILSYLGHHKNKNQVICGFAMETSSLIENAKSKLKKKNCDMIVANNLKEEGAGFGVDTNKVTFIKKDEIKEINLMSKNDLSYIILNECLKIKETL